MTLFWNSRSIIQALDGVSQSIDAASAAAPPQSSNLESPQKHDADERIDQLLLVSAAMWELVKEKTALTDEDLVNRVAILDAKDGNADGKMTYTPTKCPKCNRTIFPKHSRCLYCGAPVPLDNLFKTI